MPPTMLIENLQSIRRRVKLLGVVYGAGIVLAAAVVLLLAVVLIDSLLKLPYAPRMIINVAALVALGYALFRWVVRPALIKLTLSDLAGRLEHVFPQFDDSLRSTVNFMSGKIPGSEVMQHKTVAKATQMAGSVDLNRAVETKPVLYAWVAGLGSLVLLVGLALLVNPDFRRIAANHLLGGAEPWPKTTQIDMLSDVPQRVAVGQTVDIKMKLKKGSAKQAILHYRYDDGKWQEVVLKPDADGIYAGSVDARLESNKASGQLQIKVEAGDDEQALAPIAVVQRLDVGGVVAMVTPPAYARLPVAPIPIAERPVVTVQGSSIELQVTFNKALDQPKGVRVDPTDKKDKEGHDRKAPDIKWTFPAPNKAFGTFVTGDTFKVNDPFRFTIHATDVDGFQNNAAQEYQVIVHEDAKPSVQIEEPRRNEERTPNATIPIKAVAEDDYGIEVAQLIVNGVSTNVASKSWTIDLLKAGQEVQPGVSWQTDNSSTERKRFRLEYQWELEKLTGVALKPGDVLEFYIRVKDNYKIGSDEHPFVDSGKLRITIISHEQWEVIVENVLGQMRNEISQIHKGQETNRSETEQQAAETAEKKKYDDAQRATVGRLANQQSTSTAQAKQASDRLNDLIQKMTENKSPEKGTKETAQQVSKQLERAAEGAMKKASKELNDAKDTKSDPKAAAAQQQQTAQKAQQAMENAAKAQADAAKQLEDAMKALDSFDGLKPSIEAIEKIKNDQEKVAKEYKEAAKTALGKKPEDMTPEEKKAVADLAKKQDELKERTEKAIKSMEDKSDKMTKIDPTGSQAMKEAAATGRQQGIPQKQSNQQGPPKPDQPKADQPKNDQPKNDQQAKNDQPKNDQPKTDQPKTDQPKSDQPKSDQQAQKGPPQPPQPNGASQDMQQNQQANAQQKHREIELGLQIMLDKLKEAEKRKLETLQKQLADVKDRVDKLIVRQAGHNIDNLLLQDPTGKKITSMTKAAQDELFGWAKIDLVKMNELKPDITVLSPSQEQTERNTRDAAKLAGELPDPAPAQKLLAAAKQMEQAIVNLRKAALADAYPQQADALKALVDAKEEVAKALQKVQDELDQKNQESIRQAYVKLLEAQKLIRVGTREVNDSERDAAGNLKRAAAVRLGALPGEQGELAKQGDELGKRLQSLGSVVYDWANKDIVKSMTGVKDDLVKPDTGALVQLDEKKIEDELDAMIRNLAKKPPDMSKFDQRGGGGGGGGGGGKPKMPTDIELRLLKDLQIVVNDNTVKEQDEIKKNGGKKDAQKLLDLGLRQGEYRNLLDRLLQSASNGQLKLGKEPDNKDQLPEEADKAAVDTDELVKGLLNDDAGADEAQKSVELTGDRMARSRQRLALNNDPGKTTQEIQKRIIDGLDAMIELAQKQQARSRNPGKPKPGDGEGQAQKPQQGQKGQQQAGQPQKGQHQEGGSTPAGESTLTQGDDPKADLSKEMKEKLEEWGGLSPRTRDAMLEGGAEKAASTKYKQFIDDYYRELAKKAVERK